MSLLTSWKWYTQSRTTWRTLSASSRRSKKRSSKQQRQQKRQQKQHHTHGPPLPQSPEPQTTTNTTADKNLTNRASKNKLSAVKREQSARLRSPLREPLERCNPN